MAIDVSVQLLMMVIHVKISLNVTKVNSLILLITVKIARLVVKVVMIMMENATSVKMDT